MLFCRVSFFFNLSLNSKLCGVAVPSLQTGLTPSKHLYGRAVCFSSELCILSPHPLMDIYCLTSLHGYRPSAAFSPLQGGTVCMASRVGLYAWLSVAEFPSPALMNISASQQQGNCNRARSKGSSRPWVSPSS